MLKAYIAFLPVRCGMVLDHPHDGARPRLERAMRPVGLKLVVLDEVDPGLAQHLDQIARSARAEARRSA